MFELINSEIMLIKEYLDNNKDKLEVNLETILTKSLILTICSSYEEEIKKTIQARLNSSMDNDLIRFVLSVITTTKYLAYDSLKNKILKQFGESYVKKFENLIDQQKISSYTSLVNNRNIGSHKTTFYMTFQDAVDSHDDGKQIIIAFKNTLKI